MISKKKIIKLLVFFGIVIPIASLTIIWDTNHHLSAKESKSYAVALKPETTGVVRFVAGTYSVTDTAPLVCNGNQTYTFYGNVFNNTTRIVGIDAQDIVYTIILNSREYTIEPFIDPCVTYQSKKNYLYPGQSTKAYFAITENSDTSGNIDLTNEDSLDTFQIDFKTKLETDKKVKERLEGLKINEFIDPDVTYGNENYVIQAPYSEPKLTAKKVALASLSSLVLFPIAIFLGERIYNPKKKKKKTKE